MSISDSADLVYCEDLFSYTRRESREVMVGKVGIGGGNPIRVQSMITSDTRDTEACVAEILGLAEAGCEIVRVTAQTRKYAENLENIVREVRAAGCEVPLVADIHFKPDAALEAAKWVEKVRVNPGNYADKKKFEVREYSDEQYAEELERIREEFVPLLDLCKEKNRAIRIGTNHGSLSDRIMNRYGDTPLGMCESAFEFARIARDNDYHNFVFSMKASNPKVMIEAYRLLVARLKAEGPDWNYPIHLGVTEAGDGEDGRIKSAIGIGSLLNDGIGDTVRVSLTEDAIYEIPVAQKLVALVDGNRSFGVPPQGVASASRRVTLQDYAHQYQPQWEMLEKRESSYLPHWQAEGGIVSITYRLEGSLPDSALESYTKAKEKIEAEILLLKKEAGSRSCHDQLKEANKKHSTLYAEVIEKALHASDEVDWLNNKEVAQAVQDGFHFFDGKRYELIAWCVTSNHVHVIIRPFEGEALSDILHSWKSFTAKEANRILGREGSFWAKEYYDHLVRDGEDLVNQVQYVLRNPHEENYEFVGGIFAQENCGETPQKRPTAGRRSHVANWDPFSYERRQSEVISLTGGSGDDIKIGGTELVRVFTTRKKWDAVSHKLEALGDFQPEFVLEDCGVTEVDPRDKESLAKVNASEAPSLVTVPNGVAMDTIAAFRLLAAGLDARHSILLKDVLTPCENGGAEFLETLLRGARNIGSLICDGIGDAIIVQAEDAPGQSLRLSYNILQASGARIFKTDYVACPSCGRTLFNLQETTQKIREATGHLKGVRIAVMGCIVNGPGEMADADFGYVGGAPAKINLYVGKKAVKFNIPEGEAVERLTDLIKEHGKWVDAKPPTQEEAPV